MTTPPPDAPRPEQPSQPSDPANVDATTAPENTAQETTAPPPPPAPPAPQFQPAPQQGAAVQPYPVAGPQQPMAPEQQRAWGMGAHLIGLGGMIFSAGFLGFVGSLIVYLLFKDRGNFVRRHSANSLNVQIAAFIASIIAVILFVTVIGIILAIPLFIATWIGAFVFHIIGAVKANNGELWDPPLVPRFVK